MRKMLPILVSLALSFNIFANDNLYKQNTNNPFHKPTIKHSKQHKNPRLDLVYGNSYGDGWNGASLDLLINGEVVLDDATVTGSEETAYFTVDDGDAIETVWTEGNYDNECSYAIYNEDEELMAEAGTANNPLLNSTMLLVFLLTFSFLNMQRAHQTTNIWKFIIIQVQT